VLATRFRDADQSRGAPVICFASWVCIHQCDARRGLLGCRRLEKSNRPQRKNGPVLIACQKCGAANDEHAQVCYVCDASYDHADEDALVREAAQEFAPDSEPAMATVELPDAEPQPPSALESELPPLPVLDPSPAPLPEPSPSSTPANTLHREPPHSFEPEWKREVVNRLEAYRARRRKTATDSQPELPFMEENETLHPDYAEPEYRARLRTVSRPTLPGGNAEEPVAPAKRHERDERIEVSVAQPQFNFVLAPSQEDEFVHPHAPLVPVADVRERRIAGLLDLACLGLSYAVFLTLFRALGGHLSIGKEEAIVYAITFFLFYATYFALFTSLGGTTPGMYFRGLAVVGFDGEAPQMRQLLWRSFGYALSGGTLLLGYAWALWDEDHLSWQDRISQTYITPAPSPMWRDLSGEEPLMASSHGDSSFPDAT
jgi:uncharacterized RDD family membrane protein YckC